MASLGKAKNWLTQFRPLVAVHVHLRMLRCGPSRRALEQVCSICSGRGLLCKWDGWLPHLSDAEISTLGGEEIWGLTPADPMGTTVRKFRATDGMRIVVRNRFTFDPSMQVDQRGINNVARDHDRAFTARFPMLNGVSMDYRWGGRLCLSRNNVSVVREVETGLYSACCQNGLGTVRGTLSGMLAAELATDTPSTMLDRALASKEPSKLPPELIASFGAKTVLKWKEWQAGAEL